MVLKLVDATRTEGKEDWTVEYEPLEVSPGS